MILRPTMKRGKIYYFSILAFIISMLATSPGLRAADVVIYDFVKKAPEAKIEK